MPRFALTFLRKLHLEPLESRTAPAVVTNLADSGAGSLRQAILDTNSGGSAAGDNAITFAGGVTGTISLLTALPTVDDNLTITGPGASALAVRRDPAAGKFRVLTVENLAKSLTVGLSGMTFTNGSLNASKQFDNGGGLYIGSENVTLTGMVISNNVSNQEGGGIGVAKAGVLTIVDSSISGNTAQGTGAGSVAGGSGGAIYFAYDGGLTMTGSTVSGNIAKNRGGGIYLYAAGISNWTVRNCTFSANTAQNGLGFGGGGGAISLATNATGTNNLTITNSTLILNAGSTGKGGGIFVTGAKSPVTLESTIVSGNTASGGGPDISSGGKVTVGFSAIGTTSGFTLTAGAGPNLIGKLLNLGPLQINGGPTATHLPAAGSPVIDTGSNPAGMGTDQRGTGFARSFGTQPDIGAAETQPVGLPTASGTFVNVTAAGATSYSLSVTYDDDVAVKVSTLGTGDVTVGGPGGFTATPAFVMVDNNTDGKPRTATYTFTPPGGSWDAADDGAYTVSVAAGQVADTSGNTVAAGAVGSFQVLVPKVFVVTNANDSGTGSLRQAMLDANALAPSADTITFDAAFFSTPRTTILSGGQMVITDSVTITGPGAANLTLDGNFASRHFVIDGPGVLTVAIGGMSLTNGRTTGNSVNDRGGSVQVNDENLTLTGLIVSNNATNVRGGAIALQGPATLLFENGKLSGNVAGIGFVGGGVASDAPGHSIVLRDSTVTGNTGDMGGGAVYGVGGSVTVERCTLSANSAPNGDGGALLLGNQVDTSALTITDSTLNNNTAGLQGGAVALIGATPGATIRNSTISGNAVGGTAGGGLLFGLLGGPVLIQNSTIAFNKAQAASGIAITLNGPGTVTMDSTILAKNEGDPGQPDLQGTVVGNYCLVGVMDGIGAAFGPGSANNLFGDSITPLDPLLGPLAANGGPTQTHSLQALSPALNTGSNPAALANDQRGAGFPRIVNGSADIGAFEVEAQLPPQIQSVVVNDGSAPRSRVTQVVVTFDQVVNLPGIPETGFQLQRQGDSALAGLTAVVSGAGQTVVTLTFTGTLSQFNSLEDGRYTLTVFSGQVSNANGSLDGDANGTGGDDYVLAGDPSIAPRLFRLFGDNDGDGDVDSLDFLAFRNTSGLSSADPGFNANFDFDGDGDVDSQDFLNFRSRFGSGL